MGIWRQVEKAHLTQENGQTADPGFEITGRYTHHHIISWCPATKLSPAGSSLSGGSRRIPLGGAGYGGGEWGLIGRPALAMNHLFADWMPYWARFIGELSHSFSSQRGKKERKKKKAPPKVESPAQALRPYCYITCKSCNRPVPSNLLRAGG